MGSFQCGQSKSCVYIGYYQFRGKAQVIRLLCEYLHINYQNIFLSPDEWERYKEKEAKDWVVKDMPFLIDGTFSVTGGPGIVCYLL